MKLGKQESKEHCEFAKVLLFSIRYLINAPQDKTLKLEFSFQIVYHTCTSLKDIFKYLKYTYMDMYMYM